MNRREFCAGTASLLLLGCSRKSGPTLPPGDLLGSSLDAGHKLRDGFDFPPPTQILHTPVLIIGGGVAGLSCGWWLARQGMQDFTLLELEAQTGGNSRAGGNSVSRYPWGAHYLPLPGQDAEYVRLLLADLGVLRGDPKAARPDYDERHLCHTPQDRLYINGRWQDGIVPQFGISAADMAQYHKFEALISQYKTLRGNDGRLAFTIPTALCSRDPAILALDSMSMYSWLVLNGITADNVHWYANYGCRDDYGSDYRIVSAWAGIHYFAGRRGEAANASDDTDLTWPEGNGWLTEHMAARFQANIRTGQMAYHIEEDSGGIRVDVWLTQEQRTVRYLADRMIWAGPVGLLPHIWPQLPAAWAKAAATYRYAPWITANLTLSAAPAQTGHNPLSWENIIYDSPALGYVDATHQHIQVREGAKVFTYYRAMHDMSPKAARHLMLENSREDWASSILADLGRVHPDLAQLCTKLDVWRWGHAMAQPRAGWLHHPQRLALQTPQGHVALAHADLSGLSIFEEANYWGVQAGEWVLRG